MGSAGCVQNVPEALSLLCFGPNLAARASFTLVAVELKGNSTFVMIQQMLRLCSQELPGRWIAALLFKVHDLLDFNPGLSGAPGKLCPGTIQMCCGWAGSVQDGQGALPALVAPGPGSCVPSARQ